MAPLASILLVVSNLWQRPTVAEYAAGFCRKCGYNLTGLTSDRCPECGETLRDKDRQALQTSGGVERARESQNGDRPLDVRNGESV